MPSEDEYDLTSEQRANIETVRRLIGPEAASQKYCTPFNILRWINAYGNAEEGAKKLKRHLNIRKIKRLDSLEEQAEGIDEVISIYSPISILGRNKISDNKVVLFEMAGRIDIHGMVNSIQTTPFMNNRFRIMERVLRQINEMEEQTKRISGGVFVVDLDGLQLQTSLINILSGPYRIMWGTLLEQYPHIFSTIVVVNVPKFMNVLWTVCIPFITEEYRSKIIITSEKWRREILEYIDAECLPVYYGGTMVDKHGDQRCRSLIAVPPSTPFPSFKLIPKVELDVVSIPAGGKTVQMYRFEMGSRLEIFMQHDQEFTLIVLYSNDDCQENSWKEDELEEVYAGCERPALTTTDHWEWTVPYSGFYYFRYGNEKAWFKSVSVKYRINIITDERKLKAESIEEFFV
ncbi:CRAL-TRIO domain-containing protein F28H7.8 [Toxocara canis]|uniref:CRAL-TRIO domain-containing protein F28H7.8 n=2 Tax=Toxocara canis TaxID=6265 RepID=A0A0B2VWQ4_TOXCA|nr:CRAL-TRIO domain-containing protein F28H7.8 [Toxocara canis]VDM40708.1 unnamed protein product [Toxocara canis]